LKSKTCALVDFLVSQNALLDKFFTSERTKAFVENQNLTMCFILMQFFFYQIVNPQEERGFFIAAA